MKPVRAQKLQMLRRSWFSSTSAFKNVVITGVFIEMQKLQKLKRIVSLIKVFIFINSERGRERKKTFKTDQHFQLQLLQLLQNSKYPFVIAFYAAEVGAEDEIIAEVELLHGGQNELP